MAGSARFQVDMALNASDVIKGSNDAAMALADLEDAVGEVADESAKSGGKVDSFATKLVEASRKAGKSDDDIKDALRGMGLSAKQAERAVDEVGDEFRDTGREGERAGDKLEDAMRDVQRASEKASDAVGDVGDKGFRKLGDAGTEVSSELRQNLGETFSSFRGDLEDLPQVAQDVFGGLAGSVGGLGASLALAGGAAGIGLLIEGFNTLREQEEARKERVAEWADVYIENLGRIGENLATFAAIEEVYTDPEKYDKAAENAELWGTSVSTAVNIMAGDMVTAEAVTQSLAAEQEKLNEKAEDALKGGEKLTAAEQERTVEILKGQEALRRQGEEMAEGAQRARELSDSYLALLGSASEASLEVDELGNKLYTLPSGEQIMVDVETGQATTDLDAFQGDADGVIDHVNGKDITLQVKTASAIAAAQQAADTIAGLSASITVNADTTAMRRQIDRELSRARSWNE